MGEAQSMQFLQQIIQSHFRLPDTPENPHRYNIENNGLEPLAAHNKLQIKQMAGEKNKKL